MRCWCDPSAIPAPTAPGPLPQSVRPRRALSRAAKLATRQQRERVTMQDTGNYSEADLVERSVSLASVYRCPDR
ncbi:hypothetical protein GCM10022220_60840 [Actinocatenispora rupis]|uniref:Uncharacterized protein n=1 Tax=Actinocatenispora rupis TaxID=519421 RepID=A0A8J3NDG9_9ACTN|nr:hypothetical protein Aru02nite_62080 [Actinocatenispora rupis]